MLRPAIMKYLEENIGSRFYDVSNKDFFEIWHEYGKVNESKKIIQIILKNLYITEENINKLKWAPY